MTSIGNFLLYLCFASSAHSVVFNCKYRFDDWTELEKVYNCLATVVFSEDGSSLITEVKGNHLLAKNNLHVEGFDLQNQDLRQIPHEIGNYFPHIKILQWWNSNLWSISSRDLQQFPNLILLNLSKNKITTLESDIFRFNPRLITLYFENNLLFNVGEDFIGNLRYLSKAYFRYNPCFSDYEISLRTVRALNEKIPIACPFIPEEDMSYPQPTTVSLSQTQPPEECPMKCLNIISSLQDRMVLFENIVQELIVNDNSTGAD